MLPFPALVGLDNARQALLLLAVDPGLGGVVLAAGVGTGKSTLMRSFSKFMGGGEFVELPVGVTEDRLLGGLDLEATLATGSRVHRSGLMARAHGGLLYADGVNLLDDSTTNHILAAFDSGIVQIEREGLSVVEPSRFCLLATYDPAEGPPRHHLMDRVGLIIAPIGKSQASARAEVVRRNLQLDSEHHKRGDTNGQQDNGQSAASSAVLEEWLEEEELMQAMVQVAREALPTVTITDEQVEKLVNTALIFGVEGHRADIFATRAALASAALSGREEVEDEDLERAVRYVLIPRATRAPQFEAEEEEQQEEEPPPPEEEQQEEEHQGEDEEDEEPPEPPEESLAIEDLILEALDSEIPPDVLETPFTIRRSGQSGSRGTTSGNRGRHIRSVLGNPGDGRLDIVATLRASAPWQRVRKKQRKQSNKRRRTGPKIQRKIELRADDLHVKRYRSKAGTLFCFLVDASGSMALHRMRQAKGAVNALLQQAYVHRDQVALLAFRGERADVLMPPSQSVELAKRALDVLPTGGGTPLPAALMTAYTVAEQAQSRGIHKTTLVIITDGRPNVPLNFDPTHSREQRVAEARDEVQRLAGTLRMAGIGAVVIDTQRNFISRGEAQQLAAWLGGRYFYLPQGRGEDIAKAVIAAEDEER